MSYICSIKQHKPFKPPHTMYETYDEYLRNEYENDNIEELHDAMADVADDANQRELDERSSDED